MQMTARIRTIRSTMLTAPPVSIVSASIGFYQQTLVGLFLGRIFDWFVREVGQEPSTYLGILLFGTVDPDTVDDELGTAHDLS
jgi:hypothetical protein